MRTSGLKSRKWQARAILFQWQHHERADNIPTTRTHGHLVSACQRSTSCIPRQTRNATYAGTRFDVDCGTFRNGDGVPKDCVTNSDELSGLCDELPCRVTGLQEMDLVVLWDEPHLHASVMRRYNGQSKFSKLPRHRGASISELKSPSGLLHWESADRRRILDRNEL